MSTVLPQVLLLVHIIGGSVALLCAGGALVTKKADPVTVSSKKVISPE